MVSDVLIIRRPVKHARLRVREDTTAVLVVPKDFNDVQIKSILSRKARWIEQQHDFFRRNVSERRRLGTNQVLLFGETYRFVLAPELGKNVAVVEAERLIRSGRDLSQQKEREKWYRSFARSYLSECVAKLSSVHNLKFGRLFVLSQRKRWGACSPSKNISLNWQLIYSPHYVIDYVIVHELLHTMIPNHTQRFWVHVAALCPQFRKAIDWLHRNKPEIQL